jgi:pimeloyl-ACP methyl ester carboxylesterase
VVPSLPGYGFSAPLKTTGINVPKIAHLWSRLMTEVLGYPKFGAIGGDWGAAITSQLGHAYADQVIGIHQTVATYPGLDFMRIGKEHFAPDEQWMFERNTKMRSITTSHVVVHCQDPQTLAYALVDSPVGTAAWLWERRRSWSDCDGDVLKVFDRDSLCTLASVYWLNGSIATSMRLYWEQFGKSTVFVPSHNRTPVIEVPAGFSLYPKDNVLVPRSLAELNTNLKRWTIMEKGGHFGAAEHPEPAVHEYREFFRPLRS